MSQLDEAFRKAEERKRAIIGSDDPGITFTHNEGAFIGFDLDYEEVVEVSNRAGHVFYIVWAGGEIGCRPLFTSAWIDGFLVGLFAGQASGKDE